MPEPPAGVRAAEMVHQHPRADADRVRADVHHLPGVRPAAGAVRRRRAGWAGLAGEGAVHAARASAVHARGGGEPRGRPSQHPRGLRPPRRRPRVHHAARDQRGIPRGPNEMGCGHGRGARVAVRGAQPPGMQRGAVIVREGVLRRVRRGRPSRGRRRQTQVPVRAHPPGGVFPRNLRHRDLPGGGEQPRPGPGCGRGFGILSSRPAQLTRGSEQRRRPGVQRRHHRGVAEVLQETRRRRRSRGRRGFQR
mmetsp:Transcript_3449/g.12939  ORF Transcript_3449/g.12939 Transcript_3449/m.12939 type:complete len:250 (+) Transcript_3449:601-1350(+)